jgi:hypothetical protein
LCDRGSFHILFISITSRAKVVTKGNADQNYYGNCNRFDCHAWSISAYFFSKASSSMVT